MVVHAAPAVPAVQQASQQRLLACSSSRRPCAAVLSQLRLHLVPQLGRDDRLVLALVDLVLVGDLPVAGVVGQQVQQAALVVTFPPETSPFPEW